MEVYKFADFLVYDDEPKNMEMDADDKILSEFLNRLDEMSKEKPVRVERRLGRSGYAFHYVGGPPGEHECYLTKGMHRASMVSKETAVELYKSLPYLEYQRENTDRLVAFQNAVEEAKELSYDER